MKSKFGVITYCHETCFISWVHLLVKKKKDWNIPTVNYDTDQYMDGLNPNLLITSLQLIVSY